MWSHDYQVETFFFRKDRGSCKSSDPDRQPWGVSPDKEGNGELLATLVWAGPRGVALLSSCFPTPLPAHSVQDASVAVAMSPKSQTFSPCQLRSEEFFCFRLTVP